MKCPEGYVQNQREGNFYHLDGREEHPSDAYPILEAHEEMEGRFKPPQSILVVGCRVGYELEALTKYYPKASILGVDIVPEFVAKTRKRGFTALEADMHKLPFARSLFDWTFCVGTLEHAYNAPKAAKELLRVTRKALYVTADMEEESKKLIGVTPEGIRLITSHCTFILDPEQWKAMFSNAAWRLSWEEKQEATLHMIWEKT
jgi:SAM-dependent methyltransferase